MKYTKYWLNKIEALLEAVGYTILYEKGNFQSGYCIVENRKVAVVNKYFDTEGRINCLVEILSDLEVEVEALPPKAAELYQKLELAAPAPSPPPGIDPPESKPREIDPPESKPREIDSSESKPREIDSSESMLREIDSPESMPSVDSPEATTPKPPDGK